jgi:hypothetical protein
MATENKINQLVRSLLQKDSIEKCTLQELEQFANRHPYFGAAQLLLAKKMQVENNEGFHEQLQKTFLFFHNPLWVQKLLGINGSASLEANPQYRTTEIASPVLKEDNNADVQPAAPTDENREMDFPAEVVEQEVFIHAEEEKTEFNIPEETAAAAEPTEEILERRAEIEETHIPPGDTGTGREEIPAPVSEELKISIPAPVDIKSDSLTFEPYHTVDYFASQGIRWKAEDRPADKFGRQLKSFTDWLKTMKRLPATEIAGAPESGAEKKVEEMAQHSLEDRDVVTEAMAEVWIKQGNPEKARAIYRKLSLSEPSKSAYFAAKIDELK